MAGPAPDVLVRARGVRLLVLDVDGVMTDGRLYFDSEGQEIKAFHTRDGLGLKAVQACGIELAIITGRESPMVTRRAESLGIAHVHQGSDDKLSAWEEVLRATGVEARHACYAGDDWVDLPLLRRAGLAVTVPEADQVVRDHAHWVTQRAGGHGAVREICQLLLDAQGSAAQAMQRYLEP